MDPHQRRLGQSQHIVHNPGAEGQVLVVTVVQAVHKPWREEAMVSGYAVSVRTNVNTTLKKKHFTYWPLGQSAPRGQYPERYS